MTPEIINGIFALGGALIGGFATLFSTRSQRDKRVLRVRYDEAEDLLGRFKASRLDLDLKLNDQAVSTLFRQSAWVSNDGNRPLEHVILSFNLFFYSRLFEASCAPSKPNTPLVKITKASEKRINIEIDFLNPNESVRIDFAFDDMLENRISCSYRTPGVVFKETYGEDETRKLFELSRKLMPKPFDLMFEAAFLVFGKK